MAFKSVAAGDRVRKSANEYNAFLRAAEWVQGHIYDQPRGGPPIVRESFDRVRVQNFTQAARDQFDTIELGGVRILSSGASGSVDGNLQIVLEALKPSCDSSGNFRTWPAVRTPRHTGTLLQPLYWASGGSGGSGGSGSQVGWAAVNGIHPATVEIGNVLHRRASVSSGCVLVSDMTGPYEIINALNSSGTQTCIVKKSNRASIKLLGVTGSGGIPAATSSGSSGGSGGSGSFLTPGSAEVELLLFDESDEIYKRTGVQIEIYNLADAVGGNKPVSFSTDDEGVPTIDVEPCDLEMA